VLKNPCNDEQVRTLEKSERIEAKRTDNCIFRAFYAFGDTIDKMGEVFEKRHVVKLVARLSKMWEELGADQLRGGR
jgi:hypothetical protein